MVTVVTRPAGAAPRRPVVRPTPLPAVLALIAALVAVPVAELVRVAAGGGAAGVGRSLRAPGVPAALAHTLEVAGAVTVVAVGTGTALALVVERQSARVRLPLRVLVATPLVVPEFVLGFAWSQAYGPAGLSDHLVGLAVPGLFGPIGIVLVLVVHTMPLAYLTVTAGLAARVDPDAERAARICGAGRWVRLRTVTLPLLRVPLLAGGVLVFVTAVGSFAVPQVLGTPAGFRTLSTLVYQDLAFAADDRAFADLTVLALSMAVLVLLVVGLADLWCDQLRAGSGGTGGSPPAPGRRGGAIRLTVWALAAVTVGAPLLAVALTALTRGPGLPPVPANWTVAHFAAAFAGPTGRALRTTVLLALATAVLVPLLGVLVAVAGRRRWRGPLGTVVTLAFAVPGSALAVGIMIGYGRWLTGSAVLILLAYLAKFWVLGHRPIQAGLDRIPRELTHAARAGGAGPVTAFGTVVLPPLRVALLSAAGLAFLLATHELTMSTILYGPGSETFSVIILNQRDLGDVAATAALALVLTVPVLLAVALALLVARRRAPRGTRRGAALRGVPR